MRGAATGHEPSHWVDLLARIALLVSLSTLSGCLDLRLGHIQGLDGAFFGESVSVHGGRVLIGAPGGAGDGTLRGLAHVLERTPNGWVHLAILSVEGQEPRASYDFFGEQVAIAGTTALVGAWGSDLAAPTSGSAFVFEQGPGGWHQTAVLISPDARESNLLGKAVALHGDTAVVGAPGANRTIRGNKPPSASRWSGNVYIWTRDAVGWQYQTRLAPDASSLDLSSPRQPDEPYFLVESFGQEVAIQDDTLVVAAHAGFGSPGKVYVFRRHGDTWTQEARLEASHDRFATSIALSNDTVAVASADIVFVYARVAGQWRLQAELRPAADGEEPGFQYGGSLSIHGDLLVAGALRYDGGRGAAFVFERTGGDWKQVSMLTGKGTRSERPFSGSAGDFFGYDVAIDGETIVIGASFHDSEGPNNGAAYVFERSGSQWIQDAKLTIRTPWEPARDR